MIKPNASLLAAVVGLAAAPAFARETPPLAGGSRPAQLQSPPRAEQPPSDPVRAEVARHGIYLHAELGAGYRAISDGQAFRISGAGFGTSLLLGGSLAPNLFLLGELSLNNIINPTVQVGGSSAQARDSSALLLALGPGVVYYVMPANVSLGASLLLSRASVARDGVKVGESEFGYGGGVRVSKEWWVGKHSGLGLGAAMTLASMKDKDSSTRLVATAYTLGAAYTY
jgi:hypothetical protein